MPLLPCPNCQQKIPVTISRAGAETTCPSCATLVPIPKLGKLRQLDAASGLAADDLAADGNQPAETNQVGRRVAFAGLMGLAGMLLIAGLFCLVRYLTIDVPVTTEIHIQEIKNTYKAVPAAQLVREWQQMEKFGLDAPMPYTYKKMELEKDRWGRNGLICLGAFTVVLLIGMGLGLGDRRRQSA